MHSLVECMPLVFPIVFCFFAAAVVFGDGLSFKWQVCVQKNAI